MSLHEKRTKTTARRSAKKPFERLKQYLKMPAEKRAALSDKELIEAASMMKTAVKQSAKESVARQAHYLKMPAAELAALSDAELIEACFIRTDEKVEQYEMPIDGVNVLSEPERVFYTAWTYEMEVNNGGLCQFFVNSSRALAPLLSDCLGVLNATDHQRLFDAFILDNGIDVNDLSFFIIEDAGEFETQTQRYPFDDFDSAFYALKPVSDFLAPYLRAHLAAF